MNVKPGGDDAVRLKPLRGIAPGRYLAVLYAALLCAAFFCVFMLPGVSAGGTVFEITSDPPGAAARVDGVYMGRTPCAVLVPAGTRELAVAMPGFEEFRESRTARARLFIRRPFVRPVLLRAALREREPLAALAAGAREYAEWSFTGEADSAYSSPPALSRGAARSASRPGYDAAAKEEAAALLRGAARFTNSRFALADMTRAFVFADNRGAAPSPAGLLDTAAKAAALLNDEPLFCVPLADILPDPQAALVLESGLYPRPPLDPDEEERALLPGRGAFGETVSVGGARFRFVRGATFTQSGAFPRRVDIGPFYIALDELSAADWEAFCAEEPRWARGNAEALAAEGLAAGDYRGGTGEREGSVSGISAYAAEAYCARLGGRLPAALSGYEARLPTEAEWEFAAKAAREAGPGPGIPARMTAESAGGAGLWEWCADGFAPQNYLPAGAAPPSGQRNVRGGAWVNPRYSVTAETRGSLPPDACSPFVTARIILAKKAD